MAIIQVENAVKTYRIGEVETRALDGVDLGVEKGEFMALVGPSGSGKTTLLQIIGCLDKPDSGVVKINEQDVTHLNANQRADLRRGEIGFIFQFFALVPVLTAYENVELSLLLNNVPANERKERVMGLLDAVGIAARSIDLGEATTAERPEIRVTFDARDRFGRRLLRRRAKLRVLGARGAVG